MKDHIQFGEKDKKEEIKVNPGFEDEFNDLVKKSFDEQTKRFENIKKTRKVKNKRNDRPQDKEAKEQKIEKTNGLIKKNMPPLIEEARKEKKASLMSYESENTDKLLNSKRLIRDDSKKMDMVKTRIRAVKEHMAALGKKEFKVQDIDAVIGLYNKAIKACDAYVNDPKKNKRSRRWKLVNDNMQTMNAEMLKLEKVRDLIEDGSLADKQATVTELVAEVSKLSPEQQVSRAALKRKEDKEKNKKKVADPQELKDIMAKKERLDAMERDTPEQKKEHAGLMKEFLKEKEKGLKKYISNVAKKKKSITPDMKAYYTLLVELSILREKCMSAGGGEKTDGKIREKLEQIAKNKYHRKKKRIIPEYLRQELFGGRMAVVNRMFDEYGVANSRKRKSAGVKKTDGLKKAGTLKMAETLKRTDTVKEAEEINELPEKTEEIKADPAELAAPDSYDKTVAANIAKGRTAARKLMGENGGSVNRMRMRQALAEGQISRVNYEKYAAEHQAEVDKILKKPENERDIKELEKEKASVKSCRQDARQKAEICASIKEAMEGEAAVMLTAKDSYFIQKFTQATQEPVFKEGEDLMKGLKQVGDTCYFTCELLGLVNGKHDEFIKNTLIKEHPSDRTKAIVRLHDAEGRPLDIVVEKSRQIFNAEKADTDYDKRALWVILVEKAAALVMNKTGFKDQSGNPFNGGGILKNNTDWKALAGQEKRGKDFCEKNGLSTVNINSGAETAGARMLFGSDILVLNTREGLEYDEKGDALSQYNENSDIVIGQMAEFLKQGKIVVGGTCASDGIPGSGRVIFNKESQGIIFEHNAPVDDSHAVCFKSVDMEQKKITLLDSLKDPEGEGGNETTITFGQFRRYFSNVYVIDAPKRKADNEAA